VLRRIRDVATRGGGDPMATTVPLRYGVPGRSVICWSSLGPVKPAAGDALPRVD